MTRLWLVRHGPTHAKAFAGWRDIPADLSDAAAIARLNAHLPAGALVVSSDLIRAVATADTLSRTRQRLPHNPALREFHFGDWDGLPFAEVSARWPDLSRRYWEEPGHIAPPNGESWMAAEDRISGAVESLITKYTGRDIVVVAHFGTILSQYARAAGLSPYDALAQPIDNLSVTCLAHSAGGWAVECVNHIP
jgi:broad specificity phosphatase PhoE